MPRIRTVAALATLALVLPLTAPPAAAAPLAAAPAPVPPTAASPGATAPGLPAAARTVTLVTGDRVTVRGGAGAQVVAGPGRERITFATARVDGRLQVVPGDALPLLSAGRLDPRLFDVTGLLEFGYDDAQRDTVPLILTGGATLSADRRSGVARVRSVPRGSAVRVAKPQATRVWRELTASLRAARRSGEPRVWLDGRRTVFLKESVPQIEAPAAWAAGYTGTGINVGVIDTGVDETHPDLAGRVVAEQDFTDTDSTDPVGHGTHVAATIAGTGAAPGNYRGVAPDAKIVSAKVCVEQGCDESAILAGMHWVADQGARVVNMSLGSLDRPGRDPLEEALEELTASKGVLFVSSAGNFGAEGVLGSPASTDAALAVGAVTKKEELAPFSSQGLRPGDDALKPDVTAPGVDIVAALATTAGPIGRPVGPHHVSLSGTSMASPHVAGAAALLAQRYPTWTPAQLKAALMGSARPNPAIAVHAQGAGRVDVRRALAADVVSDPPSVSFGRQVWPHHDDEVLSRTVTYRNTGTADVTLSLSLAGDLPAGMFAVSASRLTVPAGGAAAVTVQADTRAPARFGTLGGYLVATSGDRVVRTPFAVHAEVESYELTLEHLDRTGTPTANAFTLLVNTQTGDGRVLYGFADGPKPTLRLPKGPYSLVSLSMTGSQSGQDSTLLAHPDLKLDRARTVTLDARAAQPVQVSVPDPGAETFITHMHAGLSVNGRFAEFGAQGHNYDGMYVGQIDPAATSPNLTSYFTSHWRKKAAAPTESSPYSYHIGDRVKGRVPTGYQRTVAPADLATVKATYAAQGLNRGATLSVPWYDGVFFDWSFPLLLSLPGERTEYYTVDDGLQWSQDITELHGNRVMSWQSSRPRGYRAGATHHERRNDAVFGPGFNQWTGYGSAGRLGDGLLIDATTHSPAGPWHGDPRTGTTRTVVEREGTVVADNRSEFTSVPFLPPEEGAFTITMVAERGAPNLLSTEVRSTWRFRSGHVPGTAYVGLPMSNVRYHPVLDLNNAAPAGRPFVVPVEVQRQPGSTAAPVRSLTVDVSYDDGRTWRPAPVTRVGQSGFVLLRHPKSAGFVSLRSSTSDERGRTAEQTVIRAYRIG